MTKLAASVSLSAWLMVALALIVQAQPPTEASKSWFKWLSKESTPIEKRTNDDWNKLGKACVEKLSKSDQHFRESFTKLKGISKEADCTDELQEDILHWLKKDLPGKCNRLAHEYFDHYLLKCGFEKSLDQAFDNIEQMSHKDSKPIERRSASNYIKGSHKDMALSIIKGLPEIGQISDETGCTEQLKAKLADWLYFSRFLDELKPLVSKHLTLYLDKCGFEDRFKRVVKSIKQSPHIHWDPIRHLTLFSYFDHDYWQKKELPLTLRTVEKLSELESFPIGDLCTMDRMSEIQDMIERCDPRYSSYGSYGLHKLVKNYFGRYLDKCGVEQSFKKLVGSPSQNSDYTTWALSKYETLFSAFEEWEWERLDQKRAAMAIEELSGLLSIPKADCTIELKNRLLHWLGVIGDDTWFPRLIRKYLSIYLDKCGVREQSKRLFAVDIDYLIEFPGFRGYTYGSFSRNLGWILSAIEKISELESVSNDTGCSQELRTNLLELLEPKTRKYGKLRPLAVKYYALYSDKCGLEESFKKRIANADADGQWNLAEYPTLSSYVTEKFLGKPTLNLMLSLIEKLSRLDTTSEKIECTNDFARGLLDTIFKSKQDYPELHLLLREYLALYKGKCGWLNLNDIV